MQIPLYEVTRAVRFSLEGEQKDELTPTVPEKGQEEVFRGFCVAYEQLLTAFEDAVFVDEKKSVKPSLNVKVSWLKKHAKERFYAVEKKEREKNNKLSARNFRDDFLGWYERNKRLLEGIKQKLDAPRWNQGRRSEFQTLLREWSISDNRFFIRELMFSGIIDDKNTDKQLKELRDAVDKVEESTEELFLLLASEMSHGIETARASLHYYTVNKISKNFDEDIEEKEKELDGVYQGDLDESLLTRVGFKKYLLNETGKNFNEVSTTILYEKIKKFKYGQKQAFLEAVQQGESEQNLEQTFPLFKAQNNTGQRDVLSHFIQLTQKIGQLAKDKQGARGSKIKEINRKINAIKLKRGNYYRNHWGFPDYVNFCNRVFKPVATKMGKVKADLKALEQEKIEARLLRYWARIVRNGERYFLLLIPKEKISEAKCFFNVASRDQGEYVVYEMNSLTERALRKLIRRNLPEKQKRLSDDPVGLCQEVLRGEHPELSSLDFDGFEDEIARIANTTYENEEAFRGDLENVAYVCAGRYVDEPDIQYLRDHMEALCFEITSYDFQRELKGKKKEPTLLWEEFWRDENRQNGFPVRLNPELRVFYRPKREQKVRAKQNNRFSRDHLGVAFTITRAAAGKRTDIAFKNEEVLSDMVEKFNAEVVFPFTREKAKDLYYYGIDRGSTELATLCVTRFDKETYKVTTSNGSCKENPMPLPVAIKAYKIKNEHLMSKKEIVIDRFGNKKEVTLYENPSYFLDDAESFEENVYSCLDLTTAKLINGKIIINGDVQTHIALKRANAKRQLFEKYPTIASGAEIEFDENERKFQVRSQSEYRDYEFLSYYPEWLDKLLKPKDFQQELAVYLARLRTKDGQIETVTMEQINHLRGAITANMVGIIAFLYEQYPGVIALEKLNKNTVRKHFQNNNENIERPLEWALYKKFQKIGLVPPHLRRATLLREEHQNLSQFGVIHFVSEEETSGTCPRCKVNTPGRQRQHSKFGQHRFICQAENCGFDTNDPKYPYSFIKNSDDVAAYNIAKELHEKSSQWNPTSPSQK